MRELAAIDRESSSNLCFRPSCNSTYCSVPLVDLCLRDEYEGDNVGPAPPVAVQINHDHIAWMREKRVFQSRSNRYDRPSGNLANIQLRRIISTEPLHEPYLVALLIALAQQQWRTLGPGITKLVSGVKPKLLYTSDNSDFMHIYSENVSSALIGMFDNPAFTPPAPRSLSIYITAIPYRPLETLRDRIMALLLEAISLEAGKSCDFIVYK